MAESFVQLNNDGPGKKIDTFTEATNGQHRQAMVVSDPSVTGGTATVDPVNGLSVAPKTLPPNAAQETGGNLASLNTKVTTTANGIKVDGSAVTQPVSLSGNATVVQPTGTNLHTVLDSGTITSISNPLPSGTNVIGHVIADSGSTTVVTGNVTVVQPTGTNLHTVLDSGTLTSITNAVTVSQATAANLNATVTGTVTTTPPSNASTNVTQFGGNNVVTGTGVSGVGIPRVTVSNDSVVTATQGTAAAGTAGWPTIAGTVAASTATWTSATAGNTTLSIATTGYTTVLFSFNGTGTLTGGVVTTEASDDGGTTWYLITGVPSNNAGGLFNSQTVSTGSLTAVFNVGGYTNFRARLSTVISGTGSVVIRLQGNSSIPPTITTVISGSGIYNHVNVDAGTVTANIKGNAGAVIDGVITAATAPVNGLAVLSVNNTTPPSLTTGQSVALQCDYVGSLFVKSCRRSQIISKATTIAASTTATTVLAAQAAGIFADITNLWISSVPAATATAFTCTLSDGTVSYVFDMNTGTTAGNAGMGVSITFDPPLPATNAATAWTVANSSATPTTHILVSAVLQKAS
jgi:hypothetical protein